jgi:hypothetical protein
MKKIFIVQSSAGSYDDYHVWNERAFISREKAELYAKEIDLSHNLSPIFNEVDWDNAWIRVNEIENKDPNRFKNEYNYVSDSSSEWSKRDEEIRLDTYQIILSYIHEHVDTKYTIDDVINHENYEHQMYIEYHPCDIKELELDDTE